MDPLPNLLKQNQGPCLSSRVNGNNHTANRANGILLEHFFRGAAPLDFDADFSHELEGGGALADAAF
jgi:hypothetical protein